MSLVQLVKIPVYDLKCESKPKIIEAIIGDLVLFTRKKGFKWPTFGIIKDVSDFGGARNRRDGSVLQLNHGVYLHRCYWEFGETIIPNISSAQDAKAVMIKRLWAGSHEDIAYALRENFEDMDHHAEWIEKLEPPYKVIYWPD